jgi:hypothetical protein
MWTIGRITKTVSDVTIGTAIVMFHVAMADRLELRRRMPRRPLPPPPVDQRSRVYYEEL